MLKGETRLPSSKPPGRIVGSPEITRSGCSARKGGVLYSRQFIACLLESCIYWKVDSPYYCTRTPVGMVGGVVSLLVWLVARPMRVSPTANRS